MVKKQCHDLAIDSNSILLLEEDYCADFSCHLIIESSKRILEELEFPASFSSLF